MNCRLHSLLALVFVALALPLRADDYAASLTPLIARLADADVGARYAAQMQLQAIASDASKPGNESARTALATLLATRAAEAPTPQPARVWIVRQLQYIGGAESVPALTQLLGGTDAELRECARRALETNPASEASQSLRNALQAVATDKDADAITWKIGLMNSLAQRRDTAAVGLIAPRLAEPETQVAAAKALGRIANAAAVSALQQNQQLPAAAEALVTAAGLCSPTEATAIYSDLVARTKLPAVRAAAILGLAKTSPETFAAKLPEWIAGSSAKQLQVIIEGAGLSPAGGRALAGALPTLPPEARIRALHGIAIWEVESVRPITTDADPAVRAAAIAALGRMDAAGPVGLLVEMAAQGEASDRAAAQSALAANHSAATLAALHKLAASSKPSLRTVAVTALAARNDTSALPLFTAALRDQDAALRKAAIAGLRHTGGDAEIEPLARLTLETGAPDAAAALAATAERTTNKPAAARTMLALAADKEAAVAALADALAEVGGEQALAAVARVATAGKDADARAAALDALGNWSSLDAAKPLLTLAQASNTPAPQQAAAVSKIAALLTGAETASVAERESVALATLEVARGTPERKQLLSAVSTIPSVRVATAVQPWLQESSIKGEAGLAIVIIAETLPRNDPAVQTLAKAVRDAAPGKDARARAEKLIKR